MGKSKKGKSAKNDGFNSEDEIDPILVLDASNTDEESSLATKPAAKKSKKVKTKKTTDAEDDGPKHNMKHDELKISDPDDAKPRKSRRGVTSSFAALEIEDEADTNHCDEDSESEAAGKKPEPTGKKPEPAGKKKSKKARRKKFDDGDDDDDDDDDIESLVASIEGNADKGEIKVKGETRSEIKVKGETRSEIKVKGEVKVEGKDSKNARKGDLAIVQEGGEKDRLLTPPAERSMESEPKKTLSEEVETVDIANMTQDQIAAMMEASLDPFEDDQRRKKKKKQKKESAVATKDDAENQVEEEEEGGTVKTAAQKKKEKKERQRQQKLKEKEMKKDGKNKRKDEEVAPKVSVEEQEPEEVPKEKKVPEEKPMKEAEQEPSEKLEEQKVEPSEMEEGKGKKKKGKKEAEETKENKRKPNKALLKAMQDALIAQKEEEERLMREEDEAEERRIAMIQAKKEEEKRKAEKKEEEKRRKKEKIEKLKKEGKYLTPRQREDQRRAREMVEAMKAQGLEVPDVLDRPETGDGKKKSRVVYDRKKKGPKPDKTSSHEATPEVEVPVPNEVETSTKEDEGKAENSDEQDGWVVIDEKVKGSWDDGVKDAWDATSDEDEDSEAADKQIETAPDTILDDKKPVAVQEEEEDGEASESEESDEEESESESDSDSEEEEEEVTTQEKVIERIQRRKAENEANVSLDNLRAPVVCVLGHVDTGKTKILDKLRRTNVQDGEAGGITQQIGATNVPERCIREQTKMCKEFGKKPLKLPGLLIIDTPGHESFSNLRVRGSSMCDIAVLVVDIMHSLEAQTIESINLLKERKTPFVIALNKVDKLYGWQPNPSNDIVNTLRKQKPNTRMEFEERAQMVITQMSEQGLNAALFYENKNMREYVSMVPTSAHSGDGMGNLIALICELTSSLLARRLALSDELQATVMEVKTLPGLGMTIDVILVNGSLKEGQTIVVAGTEGPIVTQVRGLLMPQPMRELRVKNEYERHSVVKAAQGVKVIAKELDKALAGLQLLVAHRADEVQVLKDEVKLLLKDVLGSIKLSERGVHVQASTLGSLEALLEFLKNSKIPYSGINIGPVHRKDVIKASVMLEHDSLYATILAFDVRVEREAQEMADTLGVKIFTAPIIYHLFDNFEKYRDDLKRKKQEEYKHIAVFPCRMKILPQFIFNSRDPIVMGVSVEQGFVKVGTPICVPTREFLDIGRVSSLEINHKPVEVAKQGVEVCVKIDASGDAPKMFGRHFDETDILVSKISRESIDAVKNYFRDEMVKADWQLMVVLKKQFAIL